VKRTGIVLTAFLAVVPAAAQSLYTTVNISVFSGTTLNSGSTAKFTNQYGNVVPAYMLGYHSIINQAHTLCVEREWAQSPGQYAGTVICTGAIGSCYRAEVWARTVFNPILTQSAGSSAMCFYEGGGGCGCDLNDEGCPLLLNPDGGPWRLTGAADSVRFDLDADGQAEQLGWTAPNVSVGFLSIDLNGNGAIDDGAELFGIGTLLPNGERAPNGFVALRQYDVNNDGLINAADPIWSSLLLWTDRNHDATSQQDEIVALASSVVTALELEFSEVGKRDQHGNKFRYEANCRIGTARKPFYDVFLVRVQ
jgi:hypothetical protein